MLLSSTPKTCQTMKTKTLLLVALGLASVTAWAQSFLSPGELMFTQLSSDPPDTFSFVFTKNVQEGTTLTFTDNGWDSTDFWRVAGTELRMTENSFTWTAPAGGLSAGTMVTIDSHNLSLATSGDNLFAFQGSWTRPNFVSGATWDQTATWLTAGSATANDSYLPGSLANGTSAFARGATGDNTGYTGATTSGTTAALRTAIYGTPANWGTSNTLLVPPTAGPYTFTDATDAEAQVSTLASYGFGLATLSYTISAEKVNGTHGGQISFGDFANAQVTGGGSLVLDTDGKDGFSNQGYSTENTSTAFGTSAVLNLASDAAFGFSLTIADGFLYDLENVSFFGSRNANGPQKLALFFSQDAGTSWNQIGSDLTLAGTTWGSFDFLDSANDYADWTGTVDFRIYAWNAGASTSQQLRLDEVFIQGQVTAIPEPSTFARLLLMGGAVWVFRRRR